MDPLPNELPLRHFDRYTYKMTVLVSDDSKGGLVAPQEDTTTFVDNTLPSIPLLLLCSKGGGEAVQNHLGQPVLRDHLLHSLAYLPKAELFLSFVSKYCQVLQ